MTTSTSTKLGFIGLGHMGGNMALRLLAAGFEVFGEDRTKDHARPLIEKGMHGCDTPRQVAEAADIVLSSVSDDAALNAVASGPDGTLEGLSQGKVWVDLSTVSPRVSREIAARVRSRGALMLDAPVSGSVPQVQAGTLTIMVGGDEAAYARVEPVLRILGTPTRIGGNGQGLALKLAINISLAVQMIAFSEGLLLAGGDGVDRKLAVEVMTRSAIGSPMLKARAPLVLNPPDQAWFDVSLMHKDIRLALEMADQLGIRLPSTAVADEVLAMAEQQGHGHQDIAVLSTVLSRLDRATK
jgi:3-hydroxyisobutyrate dehydrogenase-like beta-hydroxyacid dehydrogenase